MAVSKKDAARSAPRRKPTSSPTQKPAKPINGKPVKGSVPSAKHLAEELRLGCAILSDCHVVLAWFRNLLEGDAKAKADRLLIDIAVHLREASNLTGEIEVGNLTRAQAEETKGGAA